MAINFKLVSDGRRTCMELDGKTMYKGVETVRFMHDQGNVMLSIDINLHDFKFADDGEFENIEKKMQAIPEKEMPAGRNEVTLNGLPLQ